MTEHTYTHDLAILVADKNMEHAVRGLLARPESMSIQRITPAFICNTQNDSGCRVRPHDLLRYFLSSARYALVLFDYEGCGETTCDAARLESQVEDLLARNGWENRCGVVVIAPELERWVWTTSEEIPAIFGQECSYEELLTRLTGSGFIFDTDRKPIRPKEAVELLLRQAHIAHSSSIYSSLASKVSFRRCTDRAFIKLSELLQHWFPRICDEQ